jgi:hypothetical protein
MKVEYALTLADYKAALQLHARQTISRHLGNFFVHVMAPVVACLIILFWLYEAVFHGDFLASQPSAWVTPALFASLPFLQEWSIRKTFKQLFPSSVTNMPVSFSIDDDLIVSAIPDRSEGRFYWNAIDHFAQNEKVTLIYVAKRRFIFFPTRAFSPEQRAELNDLVVRHGVKAFIC